MNYIDKNFDLALQLDQLSDSKKYEIRNEGNSEFHNKYWECYITYIDIKGKIKISLVVS